MESMSLKDLENTLDNLISNLRKDFQRIHEAPEQPLDDIKLSKKPGVYMIFFEGKLQYIGSTKDLHTRIKRLLSGKKRYHTLARKLCEMRCWEESKVSDFLKSKAIIKFIESSCIYRARILENVLIAIYQPTYNKSLRELLKKS